MHLPERHLINLQPSTREHIIFSTTPHIYNQFSTIYIINNNMACTLDRTNPLGGLPPKRKFMLDYADNNFTILSTETTTTSSLVASSPSSNILINKFDCDNPLGQFPSERERSILSHIMCSNFTYYVHFCPLLPSHISISYIHSCHTHHHISL